MKYFKAVPGKGITASSKIAASTTDDFQRFRQECIDVWEKDYPISDSLSVWIEETVMGEAYSKAEEYYANQGIEFFAEPSGQMGMGSDDVTLYYPDGTEETFSIDLEEEVDIALECVIDADNLNQCADMVAKNIYIQ